MIVKSFVHLFLVLIFTSQLPKTNAKQKGLKIIIPSKIRYVHHHHTHVLIMKDRKPHKSPDSKYRHIHLFADEGRKSKGAGHHYYIPVIPQQMEDEVEDESVAKYSLIPPRGRVYRKDNRYNIKHSMYEEPAYPVQSAKFRIFERSSDESYPPSEDVVEYYEADPFFPVMVDRMKDRPTSGKFNRLQLDYTRELIPNYSGESSFDHRQLFYPEAKFYENGQNYPNLFIK